MELKSDGIVGNKTLKARSNRTFMELKYNFCIAGFMGFEGSNRTFMELKFDDVFNAFNVL